jgi:hypothetical protein
MVISCMLVLNLITLYSFVVARKNLHLYEILVYWMVLSFLRQDFNAILAINLGLVKVSRTPSFYWSIFFDRLLLIPLPQVWFLSECRVAKSRTRKIMLFVGCTVPLTLLEGITEKVGIIQYTHWKLWESAIYWMCSMVAGIWLMKWFRKYLYAEVTS